MTERSVGTGGATPATLRVSSPVGGTTGPLSEIPDPIFAESMVGPGVAVTPSGAEDALAPIAGTVGTLHPHAFVIVDADGRGVLVHLGIDTVQLKGEGFQLHVVQGESVRAGQPVVGWDPEAVRAAGYSPVCPVVALDAGEDALEVPELGGEVLAGDPLFHWR